MVCGQNIDVETHKLNPSKHSSNRFNCSNGLKRFERLERLELFEQDVIALARKLTGRQTVCLEDVCPGPYEEILFAPSLDMGPYNSCSVIDRIHGYFYPCEPEFMGTPPEAEESARLARLYKALSDEQRLRILRMLRGREMYAQEIVERTGLHQSVVSRHLMFMRAVELLHVRRQNNMKFYSLNPEIRAQLGATLDLFAPTEDAARPAG